MLIRRIRPGQPAYWTAPGGGVEQSDYSLEAALRRELAEELGATIFGATEVDSPDGSASAEGSVQHFFLARLGTLDLAARNGPEFDDPSRGRYDLDRIDLSENGLALERIELRPTALKEFILTNRENLLAKAALMPS